MATARQRKTAIRLRRMGISVRKVGRVVGVCHMTVCGWTKGDPDVLHHPMGRPRKFDHDEAIRLLQHEFWSPTRVALKMGVTKQAIYSMIDRMLESTVEEGGQI